MKFENALALAGVDARDEEVDDLLVELLRAPSPQTERLEADPALGAFVRETVLPRLEALASAPAAIDQMGNLVLKEGPEGDGGGLLLMGYAMTYPPASMSEPYAGTIVAGEPFGLTGSCAIGRGACEQKGPLAAMMGAAALLARAGIELKKPFYLAVSLAGETGRHDAAKFILENHPIRARHGIVGLGTANRVCFGNKGRLDIELIVRGKSCHSSAPWAGIDAIKGARRALDKLEAMSLGPAHPHLGAATLTPTRIESSPAINHTIQDACRVVLDRRLLPGEAPEQALAAIRTALAGLEPWSVEVRPGAFMYPSEVARGSTVAATVERACKAVTGRSDEPFYSAAALDAGYLNQAGIETIMFGPGDLRFAHTERDVVSLKEVRQAARIYAATALMLLA